MSELLTFNQAIHIDSRTDQDTVRKVVAVAIRLPDYIAEHLATPFAWGTHDCVCFAIGWVEIATGRDFLAKHRPWKDERSATRAVKKAGGLEAQFDRHLKRIAPGYAKDGDITLVDGTAYLFSGAQLVGPGKDGLVFKSRMEATCAWSY